MSQYKFRALEITNIEALTSGRSIGIALDMDTPQAKAAFLTLAGDTRGNELGEWMAELGYDIAETEEAA